MKKILLMGMLLGITLVIYTCFNDNKTLYVNIGDDILFKNHYHNDVINYLKKKKKYENYIEYAKENYRITDFINDIEDNTIYEDNKTINNLLIKADLITIWVGTNDVYYKIEEKESYQLYNYLDDTLSDMEKLMELLRQNSKEKIIVMGIYYNDVEKLEYMNYFNKRLNDLCNKYKMNFVDTNKIIKNTNSINNKVSQEIIKIIEK